MPDADWRFTLGCSVMPGLVTGHPPGVRYPTVISTGNERRNLFDRPSLVVNAQPGVHCSSREVPARLFSSECGLVDELFPVPFPCPLRIQCLSLDGTHLDLFQTNT